MFYTGLTVVIPTRNRAELAMSAIRSVLAQRREDVRIVVSDNSTQATEAMTISVFCDRLADERVRYIRPQEPLAMTQHWDWAMAQSLAITDSSHFTYLTDRMLLKTGALSEALDVIRHFPAKLLSFPHDRIIDHQTPIRVDESRWTGGVFEIRSGHLLDLVSRARLHPCLPRMLNTIVPRSRIEDVKVRFGSVFDSISPDFCFCYRVLGIFESFLFLDKPILLHYALDRSNGESLTTGKNSQDHVDFMQNLGEISPNFAAPIPGFLTVFNASCHEYCLLKDQTGSGIFPEIDEVAYLRVIASEVARIENQELRDEMESLLADHGWPEIEKRLQRESAFFRKVLSPPLFMKKLRWSTEGSYSRRLWLALVDLLSGRSVHNNTIRFETRDDAIEYLDKYPLPKSAHNLLEEPLLSSKEVVSPGF